MSKLINKKFIQYVRQGSVLYGEDGIPLPTDSSALKHRSNLLEYYFNEWIKQHENADVALDSHWYTGPGRGKFVIGSDSDKFNKDFDTWVNQHYIKNPDWNRSFWFSENHYLPIETDENGSRYISLNSGTGTRSTWFYTSVGEKDGKLIHEVGPNETLQQYLNKNYGSGYTVKKSKDGDWRIYLPGNNKTVSTTKQSDTKPEEEKTDLDKELEKAQEEIKATEAVGGVTAQIERDLGIAPGNPSTGNTAAGGNTGAGNNSGNSSNNNSGNNILVSSFDPLVTDPRTILRSTRLSKPAAPTVKPKKTLRVLPKAVARPENMPLMNRGDVRSTISDITGNSPYASSDIELVNSLANIPDNNMFKQALMNRLGMSKWNNEVALNKLNSLGIRGHIGGSDRKRLRNLINKGTTINGKIRN